MGWWQEDTALDKFDKHVSTQLAFSRQLGVLEYPLAIPGAWFGLPSSAMLAVPAVIAHIFLTTKKAPSDVWKKWTTALFAFNTVLYFTCMNGTLAKKWLLMEKFLPFLTYAVPVLANYTAPEAIAPSSFFICGWGYTQIVIAAGKLSAARKRPVVSMTSDQLVAKRLLPVHKDLVHPKYATESFPSGDAAGAAVCSTSLYLITGSRASWLPMLLSSYMRMYFWCHHLLDVVVGDAIGISVTLLLNKLIGLENTGFRHLVSAQIAFVIGFGVLKKRFKKKEGKLGEQKLNGKGEL